MTLPIHLQEELREERNKWNRGAMLIGILPPEPHPSRKFFKEHKIPLWAVAEVVGEKLPSLSSMLSGRKLIPVEVDKKLFEMVKAVRERLEEGKSITVKPKPRKKGSKRRKRSTSNVKRKVKVKE